MRPGVVDVFRLHPAFVKYSRRDAAIPPYNLGLTVGKAAGLLLVFSTTNLINFHVY